MFQHLGDLSDNRWGSDKSSRIKGFKGSTYSAARKGKHSGLTEKN